MAKTQVTELSDEETRARLRDLLGRLKDQLGAVAEIGDDQGADDWWMAWVTPARPGALGFMWIYRGDLIFQLDAGAVRWELERTWQDLEFMEKVVQALIAGQVYSVKVPGRVQAVVTLPDGSRVKQEWGKAPVGCLPMPFWPRWGERTQHLPYQ
ncbi:hypothetical protein ACQEU3_44535 [Spirillospora sp. CA-253888]